MSLSLHGVWVTRLVLGWIAWETTGSAAYVGLLSFCLFAPSLIATPLFGVLLDRIEPIKPAFISQLTQSVMTIVIFILYTTDNLSILILSLVAFVIGLANSAYGSTRQTIVPRIVEKQAISNAVAFNAMNFQVARLIGPAVGGLMIAAYGTDVTILINSLLFIPALITVSLLKLRPKESTTLDRKPFLRELLDGAKFVVKHPIIRECMMMTFISSVIIRGSLELLPVLADGVFERGAQGLGQILAAAGGGALMSSILVASRKKVITTDGVTSISRLSLVCGLAGISLLGVIDNWVIAIIMVSIIGFFVTIVAIDNQSTVQMQVTDSIRGRVGSLWLVVAIGGSAIGSILLGLLSDAFNISSTLFFAGVIGILIVSTIKLVTNYMR
jgi:predicted MFS family arabinose efflux permease